MADGLADAATLAAAAANFGAPVPESVARRVLAYLGAMLEKNRAINLTALRDPAVATVLHALDSLAFALAELTPDTVLDLGSGNGFPGVAVAALCPDASVDLMERTGKKARALDELCARTDLDNATAICLDAQQAPALAPELLGRYDVVTARAVAAPDAVAKLAAPLLAPGGHLVLWLDQDSRLDVDLPGGLRPRRQVDYTLPEPAPRTRRLGIARKG